MKILVVSGFLGAGKTTFIRELLRRTKIQAVVLENEYGETDLDSRSIRGAGNTDVFNPASRHSPARHRPYIRRSFWGSGKIMG